MEPVVLENFQGVLQAQPDWCWAAATASIYNYYGARVKQIRKAQPQCVFVRDQESVDGCRLPIRPGTCIQTQCYNPTTSTPERLSVELQKYDLLEFIVICDGTQQRLGDHLYYGGFDADEIRTYIDADKPVGLRVLSSIAGREPVSHFLVVFGYYPVAADRIVIWDPYLGERHLTLEELKRLYGPLEQKYLTKQASAPDSVVVDPKAPAA